MRLPNKELRKWEQAIFAAGFLIKRTNGGHNTYQHPDGRTFTIPDPGRSRSVDSRRGSNGLVNIRQLLRRNGIRV